MNSKEVVILLIRLGVQNKIGSTYILQLPGNRESLVVDTQISLGHTEFLHV